MLADWLIAVLAILAAQFLAWLFHMVKKPVSKLGRRIASLRVISAERLQHFEEMEIAFRVHMKATSELMKADQSAKDEANERGKLQK